MGVKKFNFYCDKNQCDQFNNHNLTFPNFLSKYG